MFKSVNEFNSAIKQVLQMVLDGKSLNEISATLGEEPFGEIIEVCCQKNYLSGITCRRTEANTVDTTTAGSIKVTYSGLQFIENN